MNTSLTFLTDAEERRCEELAETIDKATQRMQQEFRNYINAVGPALVEAKAIHVNKRGNSWSAFCELAGICTKLADRLVAAHHVMQLLADSGVEKNQLPDGHSKCEILARLSDKDIPDAWGVVIGICGMDSPSCRKIKEILQHDRKFASKLGLNKSAGRKSTPLDDAKLAISKLSPAEQEELLVSLGRAA